MMEGVDLVVQQGMGANLQRSSTSARTVDGGARERRYLVGGVVGKFMFHVCPRGNPKFELSGSDDGEVRASSPPIGTSYLGLYTGWRDKCLAWWLGAGLRILLVQ